MEFYKLTLLVMLMANITSVTDHTDTNFFQPPPWQDHFSITLAFQLLVGVTSPYDHAMQSILRRMSSALFFELLCSPLFETAMESAQAQPSVTITLSIRHCLLISNMHGAVKDAILRFPDQKLSSTIFICCLFVRPSRIGDISTYLHYMMF